MRPASRAGRLTRIAAFAADTKAQEERLRTAQEAVWQSVILIQETGTPAAAQAPAGTPGGRGRGTPVAALPSLTPASAAKTPRRGFFS